MSALTLFDLEPAVERGVHGTVVVWPSGAEVWVRDERMQRATLAMFAATTPSVLKPGLVASDEDRAAFDRDVMAPLREELRAAAEAALADVLGAGDPLFSEARAAARGLVLDDDGVDALAGGEDGSPTAHERQPQLAARGEVADGHAFVDVVGLAAVDELRHGAHRTHEGRVERGSCAEQRREVRGEVVADGGAGLFESGAADGALVGVERQQGDGDGEADDGVEDVAGKDGDGEHAGPMRDPRSQLWDLEVARSDAATAAAGGRENG